MLINLQPYAEPIRLDVCLGDERRRAGIAWDSDEKLECMKAALRELAGSGASGLFVARQEFQWRCEMRIPTPEAWQEFLDRPSFCSVEADQ